MYNFNNLLPQRLLNHGYGFAGEVEMKHGFL